MEKKEIAILQQKIQNMIHNSQERPDSKTLKRDIGVSQSVNALHKTEELDAKDIKDLRIKYNSVIGDSHSRRGSL